MNEGKLFRAMLKTQKERADGAEVRPGRALQDVTPTAPSNPGDLERISNPRPFTRTQLAERGIVHSGMARRQVLNAYREARIKLKNHHQGPNSVVLVASLGVRSQSVLTSYNLAASFALDPQNAALLVDCDPYGSDLASLVTCKLNRGVTDYVQNRSLRPADIIYPSGVDRLSVVPAGKVESSAVELFSSSRMRELMSELRLRYPDRYILVHAPSPRATTEARVLLDYCDQAVLTVPFGELTVESILDAVDELGSDKFSGLIYQQ